DARQELDEGGLAGAVLPEQHHDLAAVDVEVDVVERGDPREGLGEPAAAQLGHRGPPAVEARTTRLGTTRSWRGGPSSPVIRSVRSRTAEAPRWRTGWCAVVSAGWLTLANPMSSNPVTATVSGTSTPAARSPWMTPSAIRSLAPTTPSGSSSASRRARAAACPWSIVNVPSSSGPPAPVLR